MNDSLKLFSKKVIFIFSILMSVIFGCLLFADNLNQAGRKNFILPLIAGGFLYNILFVFILRSTVSNPNMLLIGLQLVNIIGAYILTVPVWNALLGDIETYEKKSFVGPLILMLLVSLGVMFFMLKTGKMMP